MDDRDVLRIVAGLDFVEYRMSSIIDGAVGVRLASGASLYIGSAVSTYMLVVDRPPVWGDPHMVKCARTRILHRSAYMSRTVLWDIADLADLMPDDLGRDGDKNCVGIDLAQRDHDEHLQAGLDFLALFADGTFERTIRKPRTPHARCALEQERLAFLRREFAAAEATAARISIGRVAKEFPNLRPDLPLRGARR